MAAIAVVSTRWEQLDVRGVDGRVHYAVRSVRREMGGRAYKGTWILERTVQFRRPFE